LTEGNDGELVVSVVGHRPYLWEKVMTSTGFNDNPSHDLPDQWTGKQMREGIMADANSELINGLYSSSITFMLLSAMALEQEIMGVFRKSHLLRLTVQALVFAGDEDDRNKQARTRCPVMPIDVTSEAPFDLDTNCVTSGFSMLELLTFAISIIEIDEDQVSAKLVMIQYQNRSLP